MRSYHRRVFLSLLTVFTVLSQPTVSWGTLGHRTVTAVALAHLPRPHPIYDILSLLLHNQDPTEAALFPDKIRYIPCFAYTAPWHYIDARDNPPHTCSVNMTRDCLPSEGCVVTAIANHTSRVADTGLPIWERGQSLRFMLHFFGDVHQPLHTENLDRGGNEIHVVFNGVKTNLHSVWDTLIPKKIVELAGIQDLTSHDPSVSIPKDDTEAAYSWANFLYSRYKNDPSVAEPNNGAVCTSDAADCALQWATEVNQYLCTYVLKGGIEHIQSQDLGGEYFEGAVPIIEELIFKGGRRLAAWLDLIAKQYDQINAQIVADFDSASSLQEYKQSLERIEIELKTRRKAGTLYGPKVDPVVRYGKSIWDAFQDEDCIEEPVKSLDWDEIKRMYEREYE